MYRTVAFRNGQLCWLVGELKRLAGFLTLVSYPDLPIMARSAWVAVVVVCVVTFGTEAFPMNEQLDDGVNHR